jgi:hypothetical protein
MKKYNSVLFFLSLGIVTIACAFLLSGKETPDRGNAENLNQNPDSIFRIRSMPIPEEVDFCGETISLKRLDMRERYDREINVFTYLHATTLLYFKRANRYFPMIEPILKKNNIPVDLKYLCVIESNLDIRALSPAKAAGLWQLMESTGAGYGLEITAEVDERYHIEKATEAACRYFRNAYAKYGNWADVAASYNAGMGKISSIKESQMVDSAFDMLLVTETSRYVFRILALKQIFENPRKYNFLLSKEDLYPLIPVQYETVDKSIDNLAAYAKEKGLNYMLIKEFNPWIRNVKLTVRPGKTYTIAIPNKDDLYYDPDKQVVYDEKWVE